MPPQQTTSSNPYDFIMNPQTGGQVQAPRSMGSMTKRIIVVAVGLMILLTVVLIGSSLLSNAGKSSLNALTAVAQRQAELSRVAQLASTNTVSQQASNAAYTIELSTGTDKTQLTNLLKKEGNAIGAASLLADKNSTTDTELMNAKQASNYDSVFLGIMQQQLNSYQTALKSAYNKSSSKTQRALLTSEYTSAGLLQAQVTAAIKSLGS